jgi:hypothetical protein
MRGWVPEVSKSQPKAGLRPRWVGNLGLITIKSDVLKLLQALK